MTGHIAGQPSNSGELLLIGNLGDMCARRKLPTMQDVAKAVGVSKQTVSAVINGKPGITPETSARVLAAIAHLDYHPDRVARSLATGRTHTIAMIVSDVSSPFIARMAVTAEDCAFRQGYRLVVYNTHDDVGREAAYFRMVSEGAVDGVLFSSAADRADGLPLLESVGIPVVAIDRLPDPYAGPSVMVDNRLAMRTATQHLLSLGHRRIAYINGPPSLRMTRERDEGFWEALSEYGISGDACVKGTPDWSLQAGYETMRSILKSGLRPTGVLATADMLAVGAMRAINEASLRVPDDVSVIGMDDIDMSAFLTPPLSTVRQFIARLATLGVQLLLDILNDREPEKTEIVLQPELVVRQSTAPPHRVTD